MLTRTNAELVKRAGAGDSRATATLIELATPYIELKLRLLGETDATVIEDVRQEVLLKLWKQIETWETRAATGGLRKWLSIVIRNGLVSSWRRRKVARNAIKQISDRIVHFALDDSFTELDDREFLQLLWEREKTLVSNSDHRLAFELLCIKGKSTKEVAIACNLSEANVMMIRLRIGARLCTAAREHFGLEMQIP